MRTWTRKNPLVRKWMLIGLSAVGMLAISRATGDPDIWRIGFVGLFLWAISVT